MIIHVLPVTAFEQNCSIVECEGKAVVVDAGGDLEMILSELQRLDLTLEAIWLTHGHLDHAGAAMALAEATGVEVIGPHVDDQFWLDQLPMQSQMFGFETHEPFRPHRYLEHGEVLEFGGVHFEVRHCPGHTPGHVVFHGREIDRVIVGDVLFAGSIGRTDFPRGDHATLLKSIREQLFSLPGETVVFPGHGPTTTILREMATNPYVGAQ